MDRIEGLDGKVIKEVWNDYDQSIVLKFEDGHYVVFYAQGYDEADVIMSMDNKDNQLTNYELEACGLITTEQYNIQEELRKTAREKRTREQERDELKRLKEKYE